MDQYSQHNLKRAASEPQHAMRKKEFDSELESVRSDLQSHGHADLAPKANPTFTGTPKAPTASAGTNTTQLATTAFVQTVIAGKADTGHTHVTMEIVGLDTALAAKAPLASPALTGNPTAPTQSAGNNSTRIATTAFVTTAIAGKADISHTHTTSQVTGLDTALAAKAPLASPALTGTPTAPTAASTVNNTQIATTAFVQTVAATKAAASHTHTTAQVTGLDTALAAKAPLASPSLTGIPVAPTATAGTNTTQLATTAFVTAAVAAKANTSHTHTLSQITDAATKANLASPAFTGTPTAPTAVSTVNSTQIATTAFVKNQNYVTSEFSHATGSGASSVKILRDVASLSLPTSAPTGTVKITIPAAWTVAMFTLELSGFIYGGLSLGPWKMYLGGCNHSSGPAWQHCSAFNAGGKLPFTSVRFGYDGTNVCILLGTTSSVWPYSALSIDKVFASYSGAASLVRSGWKIELITSETGITNLVSAPINNSVTLSGIPTAPTATAGTSTTQLATTAFVTTAAAAKANTSHTHTLSQITDASTKANLASPALTGTPTAPTAVSTVNNTQIATTAFVQTVAATKAAASHTHTTSQVTGLDTALAAKAPLASPALTGTPTAPTQAAGNNSTRIATTAFVTTAVAAKANTSHTHTLSQITDASTKANLASPAFTGTPTAPTAASTVNNTQIATTAFVKSLLSSGNLQFKLMTFSRLNSTYVSIGVTPKLILATFYSSFTSGENEYKAGYVYFYVNGSTAYLQTDQCSSIYNPGAIQVSGTTVRSTGWWENVTLLIFY